MRSPAALVLVRHAAADCNQNGHALLCGSYDAPLSEEGRRQVELLRARLYEEPSFDALYVSPLERALATAEAVPEHLHSSARIMQSLAEIDCGIVDGLPIQDVRRQYQEAWIRNEAQDDESFGWPGGETYRAFRQRVLEAVETIARAHEGQRVVMVTHAGVINQVLGAISGQSAARWESPRPRNASITRVLWSEDGERALSCFDDCTHLSGTVMLQSSNRRGG